jgi:hypothetical protein
MQFHNDYTLLILNKIVQLTIPIEKEKEKLLIDIIDNQKLDTSVEKLNKHYIMHLTNKTDDELIAFIKKKSSKKIPCSFTLDIKHPYDILNYVKTQIQCNNNTLELIGSQVWDGYHEHGFFIDDSKNKEWFIPSQNRWMYDKVYVLKVFPYFSFIVKNNIIKICNVYILAHAPKKDIWHLLFDYRYDQNINKIDIDRKIDEFNNENNTVTDNTVKELFQICNNTKPFSYGYTFNINNGPQYSVEVDKINEPFQINKVL